jgi:DHA2 family multidrug resistance protein
VKQRYATAFVSVSVMLSTIMQVPDSFPVEKHAGAMSIWGTGVMLGPILGPTLGGRLTDFYSWRWVFLINLPIGIASFAGIYFFVKETPITRQRFDLFGFALLALSVGTLQLMLDRGELVMWFESVEIKLYVIACVFALYFFVIHARTSENSLFSPSLFRDRNFVSGISFIFFIAIILLATMVLLPPFMQVWKGYPVVTTGLLLMPRGVGTMLTMMMAGRLLRYLDGRVVILVGMCLLSFSLHLMAGFNLQVSQGDIIASGVIQGLGLGLVFIPVTTLAYATLSPSLRDEGTALFNLARNMGTSVGVSIVMAMLSRNLWINQQDIAARLQLDPALLVRLPRTVELGQMPVAIVSEVARQAAEIAFVNDFYLLMWINILAMPLVLLLRNPARRSGAATA